MASGMASGASVTYIANNAVDNLNLRKRKEVGGIAYKLIKKEHFTLPFPF
jgi:hypothetical protein